MSHWSKVESQVTELGILRTACEELGATVKYDAMARGWSRSGANDKRCPMVISIPNCRFDIAVELSEDGEHYKLDGDFYSGEIEDHFGKDGHKLGKILEMYSVHKAEGLCRANFREFDRVVRDTHIDVEVFV